MKKTIVPIFCCFIFFSVFIVKASDAYGSSVFQLNQSPAQLATRLQENYQKISSLSFSFNQKTSGQMSGRQKTGKGNGILAKTSEGPRVRWNYTTPDRQVLISDGQTIAMYFEKLNQMIITPVDTAQLDFLFSLFSGEDPLVDMFMLLPPQDHGSAEIIESDHSLDTLQLVPKQPESQIKQIKLWINEATIIRRIELIDFFDTRTILNFSSIVVNPLDGKDAAAVETIFSFTPPDGTEIIKQ
ncbi:MAG: outer membrane lipoprotein carrier protein LolA [Desulfobacterales bacterium]|nr:outer membrane lipoprotein carrier protein LolA [Desulfobacterales bacterium]